MKKVKCTALGPPLPTALLVPGFSLGTYVQDLIDEFHIRRVECVVMGVKEEIGKLGGSRRHQPSGKEKTSYFCFLFLVPYSQVKGHFCAMFNFP